MWKMIKKYSMFLIIGGMVIFMLLMNNVYYLASFQRILFPLMEYEESSFEDRLYLQNMQKILPLLVQDEVNTIIAKREDVFKLKKIKPFELLTMMELENVEELPKDEILEESGDNTVILEEQDETVLEDNSEMADGSATVPVMFVPRTLQRKINMETINNYEALVQNFYTIDACAMIGSDYLNAETLSALDLRITKNESEPQILIYHTHSQEGFIDSVPGDESTGIVGVGEHLAQILREEYGYQVLHHDGKYDVETRNNAYSRALPDIVRVLEENPSIEVVIDLHRDAVNDDYKLVMDLDGRQTARFMFFNGASCTKKTGKIGYLENENQLENLAFSFQMKKVSEEYYPGLTRKNYIHGYRYNMHLLPRTTLIELGAQNNTLEEAMNACDPIAHILDMVLSGA